MASPELRGPPSRSATPPPPNAFAGSEVGAALFPRTSSSALSDAVAGRLGYDSVRTLCKDEEMFIASARLRRLRRLGAGAFGEVTLELLSPAAEAAGGGKPVQVAVKRLLGPADALDPADVVAFVQEARLASRLRHECVLSFVGLGCDDAAADADAEWRSMYVVSEYAASGTLKALLLRQARRPHRPLYGPADALRWGTQVARGLAAMHASNPRVIHRDLKCENIFLCGGPAAAPSALVAKVGDLGLHKTILRAGAAEWSFADIREASMEDGESGEGSPTAPAPLAEEAAAADAAAAASAAASPFAGLPAFTADDEARPPAPPGGRSASPHPLRSYAMTGETGAFIYMAPEVLLGQPYNESVDVFAYGVVLYELFAQRLVMEDLAGAPGGAASATESYAHRVAEGERPAFRPGFPPAVRAVVERCWAGEPCDRPTAAEVVAVLEALAPEDVAPPGGEAAAGGVGGGCCAAM